MAPKEDQEVKAATEPVETSESAVFRSVYPPLHRLASVVCPVEADPDDLVQEALVRVLRRGSLLDLDAPLAYLSRTVVNLASNERRRLGRLRGALRRLGGGDRDGQAAAEQPSDVGMLLELGVADRAVLWLADVEGRPLTEVADVLGCSHDAARARASRARRRLRDLLEEEDL
jgi:RNA polymerase sigma factor (sigma-70 family)